METVEKLRQKTGLTQQQLADLAGTSQPTIAAYEAGTKTPNLATLERLAESAGFVLNIDYLPPLSREDKRSLAYHQAIVQKLKRSPETILAKAKRNLTRLKKQHPDAKALFQLWTVWLNHPLEVLTGNILKIDMTSRDMRQVSPFSGVLSPQERWEVLKSFRESLCHETI